MKIYDKHFFFEQKMFLKIFPKIYGFSKNAEDVSKIFSSLAFVANFSLISQQMVELSSFSFFSILVTLYYKKNQMHVLACSKSRTRKKWYHWISELNLHLIDTFLLLLVIFNLRPSGGRGAYVTILSRFLRITQKPRRIAPRRLA